MSDGVHLRLPLPRNDPDEEDYSVWLPAADTSVWPPASLLGLNDSQYAALRSALTQEFSLIQGKQLFFSSPYTCIFLARGGKNSPITMQTLTNNLS